MNAKGEQYTFAEEYEWLGFTAEDRIFELLLEVLAKPSLKLDVFAYDLNEPALIEILLTLARQGRVRQVSRSFLGMIENIVMCQNCGGEGRVIRNPCRTCHGTGQEKGDTTESRIKHHFGMARPEGYRKAVRLMEMADRFGIPVLSIVDSAGLPP